MITIKEVTTGRDLKKFIDFPHRLYKSDANYVPELYLGQKFLFNKKKNPFFRHSKADLFLAVAEGEVVGRIAAIKNNNHNEYHRDKTGFFGFFDVIDDYNVAQALLERAVAWVKEEGLTSIIGPMNFSTNESCGILINGYGSPPVIMMPYNKPYYAMFLEKYGFGKKIDLFAYDFSVSPVTEETAKLGESLDAKLAEEKITIRPIDFKNLKKEILQIREVYNAANEKNWGFVPLTEDEFTHMADDIKLATNADPEYILVADHAGTIVAYLVTLPDLNMVFKKIRNGRLFPAGLFKLLYLKNRVKGLRIIILGVLEKYRFKGIEMSFFLHNYRNIVRKKYSYVEACYVLETNESMNRLMKKSNGTITKKYRIYELPFYND